MAVHNRLKELRHDHRMNQKEFAELLGCNYSLYNRWENNRMQPDVEWCLRIAEKLKVPVESFMELVPEE